MELVSLQIAEPETLDSGESGEWWDKAWTTALRKQPVQHRVWMGYEGLAGDGQADRKNHGGVDRAICVYSEEHYPYWRSDLQIEDLPRGAFGENFTASRMTEDVTSVGDVFSIGAALVEISQPRQPCWKPARQWKVKDLTSRMEVSGKTGFYFRVLRDGYVCAGDEFRLVERKWPQWSIERCNHVLYRMKDDAEAALALSDCSTLSGTWKDLLRARHRSLTASKAP